MEDIINTIGDTVQIIFEFDYNSMKFKDALYFTESEYNTMTQTDIDAIKQ